MLWFSVTLLENTLCAITRGKTLDCTAHLSHSWTLTVCSRCSSSHVRTSKSGLLETLGLKAVIHLYRYPYTKCPLSISDSDVTQYFPSEHASPLWYSHRMSQIYSQSILRGEDQCIYGEALKLSWSEFFICVSNWGLLIVSRLAKIKCQNEEHEEFICISKQCH